jgi:hypothetical protein
MSEVEVITKPKKKELTKDKFLEYVKIGLIVLFGVPIVIMIIIQIWKTLF